jgi:PIN domain nuclease of toxin-antitoxin system
VNPAPLLDTHIWIWWMLGDSRLKESERRFFDDLPPENRPYLCDVSLWEAAVLVEKERLKLEQPLLDFLEIAASPATVQILPITPAVVAEMNRLPADFHRDPADRLLVATARNRNLPVATRDDLIRKSRLVRLWNPART